MASGLSSPQDTALMNHQLGITTYTPPTTIAISLHTGTGFGNAKVAANEWTQTNWNYVRIAAGTNGTGIASASWSVAAFASGTGVVATNATQVSFAAASGSATPQTLATVGFFNTLVYNTGTLLFFADLAASQSISSTIIVAFFVGDISFTLN